MLNIITSLLYAVVCKKKKFLTTVLAKIWERIVLGTKRPGNETSKICVSFLGTKRLGNEKSSHPFGVDSLVL